MDEGFGLVVASLLIASVAFGFWMGSIAAGTFFFFVGGLLMYIAEGI